MFRRYSKPSDENPSLEEMSSSSYLIRALDQQDRGETARILETMPTEVSMKDSDERCALHYACEMMEMDIVEKIFEQDRTLLDCKDKNGYTPFFMATMNGRRDIMEFLLDKGASINEIDKEGRGVVHWSVVCNQLPALQLLIEKGAEVNAPDHYSATPLHYSTATEDLVTECNLAIVHVLLRAKADPNFRDLDERTPVSWCGNNGNLEVLKSLKEAGGDLVVQDRDKLTVLHGAASHGFHQMVEYYIDNVPRAYIDGRDRKGHTALFFAATYGHYDCAATLLKHGSNPNFQDFRLRTPSHCAASKGQLRIMKLLLQYSASFEAQNYRGDLPLHEAVQTGSKDVVEWLLALHPSTLDAANHAGRSSLHLAAARGNIEMVVLLCTKGCFVDPLMLFKNELYTPLDLAKQKNHEVVVEYLTMRYNAKLSAEIDDELKQKNKLTFEEQMIQAKLKLHRHDSVTDMESRKRRNRRPSTAEGIDVAVNTTARRATSSAASARPILGKQTSTTDLEGSSTQSDEIWEQRVKRAEDAEARMEELERKYEKLEQDQKRKEEETNRKVEETADKSGATGAGHEDGELSEIEEEEQEEQLYEDLKELPGISDTSDSELEADGKDSLESSEFHKENKEPSSILKRSKSEEPVNKKIAKNMRVVSSNAPRKPKKDAKETKKTSNGKAKNGTEKTKKSASILMSVKTGSEDLESVDVYEDDWEEMGDTTRPTGKDASRRYIHEKAIFQELTHLKRMQIQYGKVQEKILVRSLIGNFCKMHGLDPVNFKFQTFYAWEKFLYDALSEQLKAIYLDERERINNARGGIDRFGARLRQAKAMPYNEKNRMDKVYSKSSISSTPLRPRSEEKKVRLVCGEGSKRCDCLGKHLLIKPRPERAK